MDIINSRTASVLDEATNDLDPIKRDEILDILLEFVQDDNRSI